MSANPVRSFGKQTAGLILIFITAFIWIVTSFISESLVSTSDTGEAKVPPFLLTWLATTLFTLYLPAIHLKSIAQDCWHAFRKRRRVREYSAVPAAESRSALTGFEADAKKHAKDRPHDEVPEQQDMPDDKTVMTAALWATPLWFLAQYTFNLSLALTSVTSNTILSSTSSLFTFGLSVMLLKEKFTFGKLLCILACMGGTALVTLSDVRAGNLQHPAVNMPSNGRDGTLHQSSLQAASHNIAGRLLLDDPASASLHTSDVALSSVHGSQGASNLNEHAAAGVVHGVVDHMQAFFSSYQHATHQDGMTLQGSASNPLQTSSLRRALLRSVIADGATHDDNNNNNSGNTMRVNADTQATPPGGGGGSGDGGGKGGKSPLLGDMLVLVSGMFYAAYTVVMRLKMPGEEAGQQVALFFGYVGLLNTVCLAPVIVIMMGAGIIDLGAIPRSAYLIILLEGLLDYVLSDYLWARAVMLIGPTVATLSLSIQIPITGILDFILGEIPEWVHSGPTIAMSLLGTCLILAGFIGINIGKKEEGEEYAHKHNTPSKNATNGGTDVTDHVQGIQGSSSPHAVGQSAADTLGSSWGLRVKHRDAHVVVEPRRVLHAHGTESDGHEVTPLLTKARKG